MFHLALIQDHVRINAKNLSKVFKIAVYEELVKKYANKVSNGFLIMSI